MYYGMENQTFIGLNLTVNHISPTFLPLTLAGCREPSFLTLQSSGPSAIQPYWICGHRQNVPFIEKLYFLPPCLSGRQQSINACHFYGLKRSFQEVDNTP